MSLDELIAVLTELERDLHILADEYLDRSLIHPTFHVSAENLVHYLALRRRDLRTLQEQLARRGLSSLGRAESHVQAALQAVLQALHALAGKVPAAAAAPDNEASRSWAGGPALLKMHTENLLGPQPQHRSARIMVTMPTEAAEDPGLVRDLLLRGMDCMRINCAHDDSQVWLRMIEHLRAAERAVGRRCRISMDLAGPKLRTGPLAQQAGVFKARPKRNDFGGLIAPTELLVYESGHRPHAVEADGFVPVSGISWRKLQAGETIDFHDARRAPRQLRVLSVSPTGCLVAAQHTCYFVEGIELRLPMRLAGEPPLRVASLQPREKAILLNSGDALLLTDAAETGQPAQITPAGTVAAPARIGCTLPMVFDYLQPGQRVLFDDGRIEGKVRTVDGKSALIDVTRTRPGGGKLRSDKGINLPDTDMEIDPLTEKDLADLSVICAHADIIALSFANRPRDVRALVQAIERLGGKRPAILVKVETRCGFENLPALLLEAMRTPACGVMIARGDLAVECGFERLAELQEEILWICEAAHVPVIWATQVLESLAKEGLPSRAEITDAAMGDRAECVMLNKGPHILHAVATLDNILERMHEHQSKKRAMLRGLQLAQRFFENERPGGARPRP